MASESNISNVTLERKDTHPLQNLITAPLQAIIEAQATTTETMLDYIYSLSEAGSRDKANEILARGDAIKLKNIEFLLKRIEQTESGNLAESPYKLEVPIITMFPIPYLSIKDAELSFNFKVVDVTKQTEQQEDDKTKSSGLVRQNIIQTRYTSSKEDSKEATSDISIKITVSQTDVPMGLAKFLTNASSAIIEKRST